MARGQVRPRVYVRPWIAVLAAGMLLGVGLAVRDAAVREGYAIPPI